MDKIRGAARNLLGLIIAEKASAGEIEWYQIYHFALAGEYVAEWGVRCPLCRSTDLFSGTPSIRGESFTAETGCFNCGAEWENHFELRGMTLIKPGEPK